MLIVVAANEQPRVAGHSRQRTEGDYNRRQCSLQLRAEGFDIRAAADDCFEAFCNPRAVCRVRLLPAPSIPQECVVTGGAGFIAYKLQIGKQVSSEDMVNIFETGPDVEIATVAEQKALWSEWRKPR
ncbi:MAG TPA: hypothetical protein VN868_08050 [Terriglobales bacterium]|nr:hypothetical protein [Terriglobales bacterium]